MILFNSANKKARQRKAYLQTLSTSLRLLEFTREEMYDYCMHNKNEYDTDMVQALSVLKLRHELNGELPWDTKECELVDNAFNQFSNFVLNSEVRFSEPLPKGADPRFMSTHPLERGRRNGYILDMFFLMKLIIECENKEVTLEPFCSSLRFKLGNICTIRMPKDEEIKEVMLANGYKEKDQGNGIMDLNPYVYTAVRELIKRIKISR